MSDLDLEKDPNFLTRFYLSLEDSYSEQHFANLPMRTSIFENVLAKYFLKHGTKDFSLRNFLEELKDDEEKLQKFQNRIKTFHMLFRETGPLSFFMEYANEMLRLVKEDFENIKYDKFVLKTEFLLAAHFVNNFFEKAIDQQMSYNSYGNLYLQKERTNFNFSVSSLQTIFNFIKIFEIQNLSTKVENDYLYLPGLISSEKTYYFYCDYLSKEKMNVGNFVEYLLMHITKKMESLKNSKVNNPEIENFILMALYTINIILQNYSFYFYKKPELQNIFDAVMTLKVFPSPIGNFCQDVMETIINEGSFNLVLSFFYYQTSKTSQAIKNK